jgi:putative transcriptional regulator
MTVTAPKGAKGRIVTSRVIKNIRESLNITQRQFANAIDVSIRTVQEWEQGRRSPDRRSKDAIKKFLNEVGHDA